jgi:hypothetical protein
VETSLYRFVGCFVIFLAINALATVHYVDLNSTNATPPYTDWSTAATNIQDAIDASTNGDTVLVTNGIYNSGGMAIPGGTTNRIALTSTITVQSVNGPWVTIIQGAGPKNGPNAVRCARLANNAALIGFTLMWGATTTTDNQGGGVWCDFANNAIVENCVIVSNTASFEGLAVYGGIINNCYISANGNNSQFGAVYGAILNNCTIVSNNATGVIDCKMTNCIDYFNSMGNLVSSPAPAYSCTTPTFTGPGNVRGPPQLFADGVHLLSTSPCVGAGTNLVTGTDIFGRAWSNPPSMGCAEYTPAPVVLQPSLSLTGDPVGFTLDVDAIGSSPLSFFWFKDGVLLQDNGQFSDTQTTNLAVTSDSLFDAGDYQVVASNAFGVTTSAVVALTIHCVDEAGTNPIAPYTTWATAATNIQDAINASDNRDVVFVTNGIYSFGTQSVDGLSSNRVTVNKAIRVQSVNGPFVTTIQGAGAINATSAVRCAWLTNNAALVGFTLEGGATQPQVIGPDSACEGGAVWCASSNQAAVDNCVIRSSTTLLNGIVYQGLLNNCLINSNSAGVFVSAVYGAFVNNCTIVSNNTIGIGQSRMTNCIVYYNLRGNIAQPVQGDLIAAFCCTGPLDWVTGSGNFTNAPLLESDGIHLSFGSPCIDAGTNVVTGSDIFGVPWANPPSVGCAEYNPLPTVSLPQVNLTGTGFSIGNVEIAGQPPLSFEWLLNGVSLQTNGSFSGALTTSLTATSMSLADAGSYQLVVSNAFGAVTSTAAQLTIHAVDVASTNPEPPFTTWATAATNIQDAIEAASAEDIVLVTNGIYNTGGEVMAGGLTNRVALDKVLMVASVNGHAVTVIQGAQDPVSTNGPAAVRCAWLTNGAVLRGFTLRNGATWNTGDDMALQSGGGAWCASTNALVSNCILSNNFANYGGGGIAFGTLNNSLVLYNVAAEGGGAYEANLNNCTVENNYASTGEGGGTFAGTTLEGTIAGFTQNSIVVGNFGGYPEPFEVLDDYFGFPGVANYSYCCTEGSFNGQQLSGTSNILVDPILLDWYHISIYSPCRGAGSALYASGTDLDGEPWNNPPSIGCDEVVVADRVGPLSVSMLAFETNVLLSSQSLSHYDSFFGTITGLATYLSWNFGDGPAITNAGDTILHSWTNTGDYTVVLTAYNIDNPSGVATSQVIHVVPVNAPQLLSPSIVSNTVEFQFTLQEGGNYFVQYATNLTPPVTWVTLQSIYDSFVGGVVRIQDSSPTNAARFYRVVAQ